MHLVHSLQKAVEFTVKRSRQLTAVALILVFIVICNALFIYAVFEGNRDNARIVNYMGIIRGSIQRITKLELQGVDSDVHIRNVNKIFDEFEKDGIKPGALVKNSSYKKIIYELEDAWKILQREIWLLRKNNDAMGRIRILHISETCWEIANRLVLETRSRLWSRSGFLKYVFAIMGTNIIAVISIMVLIRRYAWDELEHLANYDPLTNVLNRHSCNMLLDHNINRMKRHRSALSLLTFDLDNFKKVNDRFGHDAGDYILKETARLISKNLRSSDVLCRLGGGEFAIIATETNMDQAYLLAERIRALVNSARFSDVNRVSVSIGVAEYHEGDTGQSLSGRADDSLYRAKKNGKNRVEIGWAEQLTGVS
jgi:diguanylate cyclase (GGDEF)-like protein